MKNIILICISTLLMVPGLAQIPDYMSIEPIMQRGKEKLLLVERNDYRVLHMEYDLVFKDAPKEVYVNLYAGRTFYFNAFGELARTKDIDLYIFESRNGEWELVAKDSEDDSEALINFSPRTTGSYQIKIVGYEYKEGFAGAKYGLLIYYN